MTVYLVGAGPGDPGLITVKGAQVLSRADVVVFDRLVSRELLDLAPEHALRIDAGKLPGQDQTRRQADINRLLVKHGSGTATVVRLKGGDPFVFGRGAEEAEALMAAGVRFEVVPGVSSAFAVPGAAGVPVTHRDLSGSVTVVTGHAKGAIRPQGAEDAIDAEDEIDGTGLGDRSGSAGRQDIDWEALARLGGTLVIMMGMQARSEISHRLIAAGRSPRTPVLVVHRGTTPLQDSVRSDLAGLAAIDLDAPSIIVVGEVAALDLRGVGERSSPLSGLSVVVTRAQTQSQPLVSALVRAGASVVPLPVIAIADPADGGDALRRAASGLSRSRYDWIVFTSANAVTRLLAAMEEGYDAGGARLAAVGHSTAAALAEQGLAPDLVAKPSTAEGLAAAMPASSEGRVLYPRAAAAGDALASQLRAKGWEVDEVEAYRTVAAGPGEGVSVDALDAASGADVVTFTSPSTVRFYLELTRGRPVPPVVACIGPVTARTASSCGLHVDIVADDQSAEGFVRALVDYRRGARA